MKIKKCKVCGKDAFIPDNNSDYYNIKIGKAGVNLIFSFGRNEYNELNPSYDIDLCHKCYMDFLVLYVNKRHNH